MSDSIDHAAVARKYIAAALAAVTADPAGVVALLAQAHATLALVEQQRVANLIALGYGHTSPSGDVVGEARRALVERRSADHHQLRPDVAGALGIRMSDEPNVEPGTNPYRAA